MVKHTEMCMATCCFAAFLVVLAFTLDSWAYRCEGEVQCDPQVSPKDMKLASAVLFSIAALVMGVAYMGYMGYDMGVVGKVTKVLGYRKFGE